MKLQFQKYGSGEAIVVLHGLLGSRQNWHSICLRLAKHFEVFAVDQRNHGESPHAEGMAYSDLAADVTEFIGSEVNGCPHLLGHSMGGKTAMQVALSQPKAVPSLVIVDISPRVYPPWHRQILDALLELDPAAFQTRQQVEAALEPSIPDLATRRFLLKNLTRKPNGEFCWRTGLRQINAAYEALSAALTGERPFCKPALFLKGEQSDYLSTSDLPRIRELFPLAQLKVVPGAGHWVQMEKPDVLLQMTLDFLRQQTENQPES